MVNYKPMTAEMSSSGTYSGGVPADVQINKDQYNKLLILALNFGIQSRLHRNKRTMMTAKLSLLDGEDTYRYILGKSVDLTSLISELNTIINK
jgi:hypothetical protein